MMARACRERVGLETVSLSSRLDYLYMMRRVVRSVQGKNCAGKDVGGASYTRDARRIMST